MANTLFGVAQKVRNRDYPNLNKPAGLRFALPFNSQALTVFNYQLQLLPAGLEWVTGAFVDNSQNAQLVQIIMSDTGQRITVPAYSQASVELLGLASDKVSIQAVTTGNVDVPIIFLNYVPDSANSIWSVIDPGTVVGALTVNGAVTAYPSVGGLIDGSGVIAVTNTPQQIFAANAARRFFTIYNLYSSSNLVGVSYGGGLALNTAGLFEIAPGGSLTLDGSGLSNQSIFVVGTAGNKFSAKQL